MSGPQAEEYKFFCFISGRKQPFPVEIAKTKQVGDLKTKIRDTKPNALAGIDADELTLYRIDVTESDPRNRIKEAITKIENLMLDDALDPLEVLSKLYPSGPPTETIHIAVELPIEGILPTLGAFTINSC
ncbi:hypothetical protein CPB86DRAFT_110426 [Serendipita vermifera]|nr:hypothetical protein CPB86DRAFT_110426 [Serendipita vermifera]